MLHSSEAEIVVSVNVCKFLGQFLRETLLFVISEKNLSGDDEHMHFIPSTVRILTACFVPGCVLLLGTHKEEKRRFLICD